MKRMRRRLLKIFVILPLSLLAPRLLADNEYIVIDGWVMKRSDIDPEKPKGQS
jgi:hypothetical protein